MICKKCAAAADRFADVSAHCFNAGTWCDCAHKPAGTATRGTASARIRQLIDEVHAEAAEAAWEDEDPAEIFAKLDAAIADGSAGLTAPHQGERG